MRILLIALLAAISYAQTADCDACVAEFMQAGGCECWADDSCNQDNLVPDGCNSCGEQAAASCGITEDDDDTCDEIFAKYPECADDYEGEILCEPSQEDVDYLMENCDDPSDSDSDSSDSAECASHDDCGGDTPFCYNGSCDTCDQCENCWDGVDGTCGPCGATTSGDTCKKKRRRKDTIEAEVGKKKRYKPTPGKREDNVPKPNDEVVRKVCNQYECAGTLTNPIPLGQKWIDRGQASARGCCKLWTSACHWCAAPFTELDQGAPKCYYKNGPGNGLCDDADHWREDTTPGTWDSYDQCMARKWQIDQYCGTNSQWCYAHGDSSTCGGSEQRICYVDGCHGTLTNLIPMGEVWERVVSKKTDKGCCAFGNGACDLCRGHISIKNGDWIYLRSQNTWKTIDLESWQARARFSDQGDWQKFIIEKDADSETGNSVMSGDPIYLRAHTWAYLDNAGGSDYLAAQYYEHGDWQRFIISNEAGQGVISKWSTVYLQAANEKYVGVEGDAVKAAYDDRSQVTAFTIELKEATQEQIDEIPEWRMKKGKRVCYLDNCLGTRTNALKRGVQWIRTHQHSDRGCCSWGRKACDWCVPPEAEASIADSDKDNSMSQSISETSSFNAITTTFAVIGLGSVLYGVYRSFVKVHDYKEVSDVAALTFKA